MLMCHRRLRLYRYNSINGGEIQLILEGVGAIE